MVIAYLMRLRRWRLNECYKWVQERRPIIKLSAGMLAARHARAGQDTDLLYDLF